MKHYIRTWHMQLDVAPWIEMIKENEDKFYRPFSDPNSYLNIFEDKPDTSIKFLNLQTCDYTREPIRDGVKYIKYLISVQRKLGNEDAVAFLKAGYDRFIIETNEENFITPPEDPKMKRLLLDLQNMWGFDASRRPMGDIKRARIVKMPAGGTVGYHRDETAAKNIRVICPLITNENVFNSFRDKDSEKLYHFPASGKFYTFEEDKIEHAVFNRSNENRYALIFTAMNIPDLKEFDRNWKKNNIFWKAYSRGI